MNYIITRVWYDNAYFGGSALDSSFPFMAKSRCYQSLCECFTGLAFLRLAHKICDKGLE